MKPSLLSGNTGPADPISTDDFNRTNSSTVGTDDQANSWIETVGDWRIDSNQMRCTVPVSNATQFLTISLGEANVDIELDVTAAPGSVAQNAGIMFRYADANNYWRWVFARNGSGTLSYYLQKIVAGSATNVVTGTPSDLVGTLRVVANGSSIEVFEDGVSRGSTTDAALASNTVHGITGYSTAAGATDWRFDNWSVYGIGDRP